MDVRICFFGDSIINGYGNPQFRGWPSYLCELTSTPEINVTAYNLGIRGDTSAMVQSRWTNEARPRIPPHKTTKMILVFSFGINDSAHLDGVCRIEPDQTLKNTQMILTEAKEWLPTIFVGPTPINESKTIPQFFPEKQLEIFNKNIADLDIQLAELCANMEVPYIQVFNNLNADTSWKESFPDEDGIHPASAGQLAIATLVSTARPWRKIIYSLNKLN